MFTEEKTEQNNALNNSIVPENQAVSNSISLTQTDIETSEAVKNTLVSKGHKLYIEDFDNLKRVETVNLKFLNLLNYGTQDTIYARVIGTFPENKSGLPMSLMKSLKDCNEKNNQNVYFVVNGGGHKAEDVKVGRALMLEIDKDEQGKLIPIDDQYQNMVDKFGIPTVAIFTGNKSLHCYYTYEEPIDPQLWQQMQLDALAFCPIADQSIKDLPRVLRLVGFKHSKTGRYSEVYAESGIKYSYEDLRRKIPVRTVETKKKKSVGKTKKVIKPSNNIVDSSKIKNTKPAKRSEPQKAIDYQIDYDAFSKEDIDCLQKIIACLEIVSESDCNAESSWFEITAGLKFEADSHPDIEAEIEEIWDMWSSKSVNYNAAENYPRWASLSNTSNNVITLGTVISKYCGGWDNVQQQMQKLFPNSKSKDTDPYYVDSFVGTFQSHLSRVLESQDYISLGGKCYRWSNTHWKMIDDDAMMTHVARESQKFYRLVKNGKEYVRVYPFGTEKDVVGGLKFFKSLHNRSDINMNNTHLIAFDNGTLDVRTGALSPSHNKSDNLTFKIAGDYIKDAELPEVAQSFFAPAFGEELIPYIRAVIQMYLNPNFPYGKFVHVIGASGSGKGTFIRLLLSMFDSSSIGSGNDLTCFNKPDKVMQELSGKSIYAFPDVSGFTSICTGFYELVDNGFLSGRNLFSSNTITKKWSVRFIVGSVNPLKVGGSSDGWERRVLQLPTKRRQGKIDPYLGQKLEDVSAQIASWAIQMPKEEAFELIQNANENKIIRQSTLEASMFGDTVKQFLDQCVVLTGRSDNFVPISKLHEHYKMYCQKKGYKAVAQNSFSSTVQSDLEHLYQKRTTVKGKRRPANIGFIELATGLFTEAQGMNPAQYNLEHESEGNLENLLNFDPGKVSSDPNQAQIETAIMFCDEDSLKKMEKCGYIPIMKFRKMLGDIDESELNQEQKELLAKLKK